ASSCLRVVLKKNSSQRRAQTMGRKNGRRAGSGRDTGLLDWFLVREADPTMPKHDRILALARTNFRHERQTFGIKPMDRRSHLYVIGKTGTGKSTLLQNLIRQDIAAGEGLALLDTHADLVQIVVQTHLQRRDRQTVLF